MNCNGPWTSLSCPPISILPVGALPLPWRTTGWCSISTMSGVVTWSFPIYKFVPVFLTCPLKLEYINMTPWPGNQFLSCNLQAAAVAPGAELCRVMQKTNLMQSPMMWVPWRPLELKQSPRSKTGLVLSDSLGLTDRVTLCCLLLPSFQSRWQRSELPLLFWSRNWKYCINTFHSACDFDLRPPGELCQVCRKIRAYNKIAILVYSL